MGPDHIVVSLVNEHLGLHSHDLFGEGNGFSGQSPVLVSEGEVMTFKINGADLLQGNVSIAAPACRPRSLEAARPFV
jgi:hypothetical protein